MKIEPEIKVLGYKFGKKYMVDDSHHVFVRGVMSINGHGAYHDVQVPYDPPLNKEEKQRIMKLIQELGSMERWAEKFMAREENAGKEKVDQGAFEEEFIKNRGSYGWETIDE